MEDVDSTTAVTKFLVGMVCKAVIVIVPKVSKIDPNRSGAEVAESKTDSDYGLVAHLPALSNEENSLDSC